MNICLVRHGIALDVGQKGIARDQDRPLSEEGVLRTREAAMGLRALGVTPSGVYSSPLLRARQTADILSNVLTEGGTEVEEVEVLSPDVPAVETCKWLERCPGETIMLVGHLPNVARLSSFLLTGSAETDIEFRKSAACMITFERRLQAGRGRLEWLIQPKALREIGR